MSKAVTATTNTLPPSTFALLESIGQEDIETLKILIHLYHEQTPLLISEIEKHALAQNSIETKKAAHTLKGSSLNMGLGSMGNICKEIELAAEENDFTQINHLLTQLNNIHSLIEQNIDTLLNR